MSGLQIQPSSGILRSAIPFVFASAEISAHALFSCRLHVPAGLQIMSEHFSMFNVQYSYNA
jgi:hypothetical protein